MQIENMERFRDQMPEDVRDILIDRYRTSREKFIGNSVHLGVDAVIHIHFNSGGSTKGSSNWGGVYSTSTKISVLKGEISMFDSTGKELISGKIKSEEPSRARAW